MINLEQEWKQWYGQTIDSTQKKLKRKIDLKSYVNQAFSKVHPSLKRHFNPEKRYLEAMAESVESDLEMLIDEKISLFRCDPNTVLDMSIKDLMRFENTIQQDKFVQKIYESLDEIAYMAEIAVEEGYDIYEVKANTPIIGYFTRKAVQKKLGTDELPQQEQFLRYLEKERNTLENVLGNLTGRVHEFTDLERVVQRYRERIGDKRKVLRSYTRKLDNSESSRRPFKDVPNLTKQERLAKDVYYSGSRYNNGVEKVIGYIGAFLKYFFT